MKRISYITMADVKLKKSLCVMMVILLCFVASHHVTAAPQPIPPGMFYREDYELEPSSQILIDRLKQIERKADKIEKELDELAEDQMEMQVLIAGKMRIEKEHQQRPDISDEGTESLPVPAAIYQHTRPLQPGKRTSYMALCHFKICNMGRKRQMYINS